MKEATYYPQRSPIPEKKLQMLSNRRTSASERNSPFLRTVKLCSRYPWLSLAALVALGGGSAVNLVFPQVVKGALEQESAISLHQYPLTSATLLVVLFAFQSLCFYFRSYFFGLLGQKISFDLRDKLHDGLIRRSVGFFDANRVSDLTTRLTADTLLIQDAVSIRLSVLIRYFIQAVFGAVLMSLISLRLTFCILVFLPLLVFVSMRLGKRLRLLTKEQQKSIGVANAIAEESFSAIRIVKAYNAEDARISRFKRCINDVLAIGTERSKVSAFFQSFVTFLMNTGLVALFLYALSLVDQGTITYGDLTAFTLYGAIVAASFSFVASSYSEFLQAAGALERVEEFAQGEATVTPGAPLEDNEEYVIEYEKVQFSFPTRPESPVLNDLSLTISPRSVTAIVGPSGAGKSAIIGLLLKYYEPQEGLVKVNNRPLTDVSPSSLRDKMALVPQDSALFGVSIEENLRYGKPDATVEEMRECCRAVNMEEFIDSLPHGFQTFVGERGVQLSGGQKQRLAIARALLKRPEILILDEATSALDAANEGLIQEQLLKRCREMTVIIIAHRLSSILQADRVVVIEAGRVVQEGTHESLRREEGLYQELIARQQFEQ